MSIFEGILLFTASLIGSAMNAVAGGGSFFTFPALIFTGLPILNANATSTVALFPGTITSSYSYRANLDKDRGKLIALSSVSVVGSILGTALLIYTPPTVLKSLLPWLLLIATILLIFKKRIAASKLQGHIGGRPAFALAFQFVISIYGGYFGGGMGILMLASLNLMGYSDLVKMNALKTFLGAFINGIGVLLFTFGGLVFWGQALLMIVASLIGGYMGAVFGTRVPGKILHAFIVAVGLVLTTYFFVDSFRH